MNQNSELHDLITKADKTLLKIILSLTIVKQFESIGNYSLLCLKGLKLIPFLDRIEAS